MDLSPLIALWLQKARDQAVIVLDPAGVITDWLGAAEVLLGFSARDAVGRHITLIFTEEDRRDGYPDHELRVAAKDQYSEDSRWHCRRDGTRVWMTGTVSAVRDEHDAILGFVKVMRDVTDLRVQTERFQHEVAELGEGREETQRFLRALGHDIRNPLGVLSNVQHILARSEVDERGRKALELLAGQTAVLRQVADDVMDMARAELGRLELKRQPQDLRPLLEEAVAGMQHLAGQKAIQLQALLPPSPLPVEIDAARMRQAVLDLLSNALKYTHTGGSVWVKASIEGNETLCVVQDTGIGIYPPVLPRIFELFTRPAESAPLRAGGVGLALVRQIVELHDGSVQAKSAGLGKGAEFSFRLPLAVERSPERQASPAT